MKLKGFITLILALVILCAAIPVSAESEYHPIVNCERMIRNEQYTDYYNENEIRTGSVNTFYLDYITIDGQPADDMNISFQWYKNDYDHAISGETTNALTFTATVDETYICQMYLDGIPVSSAYFTTNVDTISVAPTSSGKIESDGDATDTFFYVYDCEQGKDVSIKVNATSAVENSSISYEWHSFDRWTGELTDLSNTQDNITVKKSKGDEYYLCIVSDGNYQQWVMFDLLPVNTLTETIKINGVTPKRFERGHMAVAKVGEKVTFEVKTTSTNGKVSYRWEQWDEYFDENDEWRQEMKELGSADSVTVTKREIKGDPYGFERFECYIDDGNEVVNIGFVLFLLDPNQVTTDTKVAKDTPAVSLDDTTEALANSVLQDNMEELSEQETAKITLTAESVKKLSDKEQSVVDKALSAEEKVGACLDINLYKELADEAEQITETAGEINLSIEVPKDIRNSEYNYQIVRVHDGKAETLDCEYDAKSGKVSFATDKFSTYLLTYKTADKADISGSANGTAATQKSPATRDNLSAIVCALLCVGFVGITASKKKITQR